MVVVLAVVVAAGCTTAAEQKRMEREDRLSAARLGGKFHHDDPLVQMLAPQEREALYRSGMLEELPEGVEPGDVAVLDEDEDESQKSDMDKAGDVLMSVLSVSITLGMMAAPYLLF